MPEKEPQKLAHLNTIEVWIMRIPPKMLTDFFAGPLTMYAHGHGAILKIANELMADVKIFAKNLAEYFQKLIRKMRMENDPKNCKVYWNEFKKAWSKMMEVVKFMAERKEKLLKN